MKQYIYIYSLKQSLVIYFFLSFTCYTNSFAQGTWTQLQDFPNVGGRTGASSFAIGNEIFYISGLNDTTGPRPENWAFNTSTNSWTQKISPQFLPRFFGISFVINGKGYFGSGNLAQTKVSDVVATNDFYEYNSITDNWAIKQAIGPTPRYGAVGFSIGGKGYVGLGANSTFANTLWPMIGTLVKDILEYNPITDRWLLKVNTGSYGAINAQVFTLNNKAYICGGFVPSNTVNIESFSDGITRKNTKEFDPQTYSFISKSNMPDIGRHMAASFSILDRGYIVGGHAEPEIIGIPIGNGIYTNYFADVFKYNPYTDTWSNLSNTNPLGFIARSASTTICNYGYVSLGTSFNLNSNSTAYNHLNYRYAIVPDNTYIVGPSLVCSTIDAQFTLQLLDAGTVTWTTSSNIFIVSGQGSKNVFVRSSSGGNGWVQASINLGCQVVSFPQITFWAGAPPADSNYLIWLPGMRGVNPVSTASGGTVYNFNVDPVPYASSYTWQPPTGFTAIGGKITISPSISITTSSTDGAYTLYCRANNVCGSNWTNSIIINNSSGGGGGIQQRVAAYPNPSNESLTVILKETDSSEVAEINLINKFLEKVYTLKTPEKEISISTQNLPDGTYYLNILLGKELTQKQVLVKH